MTSFSFRNDYEPPTAPQSKPPTHGDTPPETYDFNFNGGPVSVLSSSKVTLVPFVPAWHAPHYAYHLKGDEELVKWMPYVPNPAHGLEEVLECYEKYLRAMPVRLPVLQCGIADLLLHWCRVASSLLYSTLQAKLPRSRSFPASCLSQTGIHL